MGRGKELSDLNGQLGKVILQEILMEAIMM